MSRVTTTYKGDMEFEARVGNHTLIIDGPDSWGGKDRGPIPPQLFMASIGSCVAVLVTHFCDEHKMDATNLSVDVDYDVAEHPTRFHNIRVKIDLPNTVCDDECMLKALEHVARHCPVHESILTLERINFELVTA